ncbi:MAG: hypothetical protein ACJ8J0_03440 [Longimicrobiaceae bacterium]
MTAATPPFPEADLRAVLAAAVAAWARRSPPDDGGFAGGAPRRLYVDAFAGAELQFGTGVRREPGEPTRADAAVRALDGACAGAAPRPVALFVEEDPAHLQRIYGELEDAVGGERLRATRDFASLGEGEASLVEAPFASVAAEVARFASGADSFFWLAPATARALPWEALGALLAVPGATLLVRFPHADFEKQARHAGPLADLPGFARRIVEGCSSLLADPKHAWLPAWRANVREGMDAAMAGVLERFQALLAGAAGERMVKPVALEAADGARTWCFLVTSSSAVARAVEGGDVAAATEGERAATTSEGDASTAAGEEREAPVQEPAAAPEIREPESRPRKRERKARVTTTDAADAGLAPEPVPLPVVPAEDAPAAEVLDLFPDDVVSAPSPDVRHLRRDGSEIVFPAEASPRARRAKTAPDDGFFAPEE